jgi:hypothetical protein
LNNVHSCRTNFHHHCKHVAYILFVDVLCQILQTNKQIRDRMATTDYNSLLQSRNVLMKSPMMNRRALPKSDVAGYLQIISPMILPHDYLLFLSQIGPGTLGNVRVFGITDPISQFDIRFHSHRLNQIRQHNLAKVNEELNQYNHSGTAAIKQKFIFFAHDCEQEDLWFAYKASTDDNQEMDSTIYVIDMDAEAVMDPVRKICKNGFEQFVQQVCLGNRLIEKDIVSAKRLREEENVSSPTDDLPEDEGKEYSFLPFGQP